MTDYGLPTARDKDGELKPVDHTYQWGGEEVTIKLIPPTIDEVSEYEDLGTDVSEERLTEIVDRHIVKPDIGTDELTFRELLCYVSGIQDYNMGGSGLSADVEDELDERGGDEGN